MLDLAVQPHTGHTWFTNEFEYYSMPVPASQCHADAAALLYSGINGGNSIHWGLTDRNDFEEGIFTVMKHKATIYLASSV